MNEENFNKKVLKKIPFQYKHYRNADEFEKDDIVFLKSNPDIPLKVLGDDVTRDNWLIILQGENILTIPSVCLVKDTDRSIMVFNDTFDVYLN